MGADSSVSAHGRKGWPEIEWFIVTVSCLWNIPRLFQEILCLKCVNLDVRCALFVSVKTGLDGKRLTYKNDTNESKRVVSGLQYKSLIRA